MSASASLDDIMDYIGMDDSDYQSSGDEYIPSREEIRELEEEMDEECCAPKRKKIRKKRIIQETDDDDDDDAPLATLCRKNRILDSDDDTDDDITLAELAFREKGTSVDRGAMDSAENPTWLQVPFQSPDVTFTGNLEQAPVDGCLKTPYEYFKELITDDQLEYIEQQTIAYSIQKEGISLKTTRKEIEVFIGIYLRMGLVQAHSVRAYWDSPTRYPPIAEQMNREKFKKLASSLHFVDNLAVTEECKTTDKLWKIRPWLDGLQKGFEKIPPEEYNAVDEIMVSFKGHSSLKQYIKSKPKKWGFKMWGRCGSSGILYQFDVYQGAKPDNPKERSQHGVGGEVVLQMISNLAEGKNYKLFADNFFTTLSLVKSLKEKSILFVGTVRSNRLKGCELKTEKQLKEEGRGAHDSKVEKYSNTIAVRWYDNRTVDLVSSYKAVEPETEIRRWDKRTKQYVTIKRPAIVTEYNKFMGGADLLDSLTALYKYPMKSRRWYMYIFYHTLSVTVVNAWLWYKRHCTLLKNNPMKLSCFQAQIVEALILCKRPVGRPSSLSPVQPAKTPSTASQKAPVPDIRLDGADHLPVWGKRGRCKNTDCKSLSFVLCCKCKVFLCLNKDRNCFFAFHKK